TRRTRGGVVRSIGCRAAPRLSAPGVRGPALARSAGARPAPARASTRDARHRRGSPIPISADLGWSGDTGVVGDCAARFRVQSASRPNHRARRAAAPLLRTVLHWHESADLPDTDVLYTDFREARRTRGRRGHAARGHFRGQPFGRVVRWISGAERGPRGGNSHAGLLLPLGLRAILHGGGAGR